MRTPERRPGVSTDVEQPRPDDARRTDFEAARRADGAPAPAEPVAPAAEEERKRRAWEDRAADEQKRRELRDAAATRDEVPRMEDEGGPPPETAREREGEQPPLLPHNELDELRSRWTGIQGRFVDEPRAAVEAADALVASAIQRIAQSFAAERSNLERQWGRSGDGEVSTEDLRQALRRYRSFFDRLLSI